MLNRNDRFESNPKRNQLNQGYFSCAYPKYGKDVHGVQINKISGHSKDIRFQ